MMLFSLFGGAKRFAKKPAFDMEAASELGLHANRFPTEGGQLPTTEDYAKDLTAKARAAYKKPVSTQIAKGTGLEKGYEMLGLHKGERDNIINPSGDVNYAGLMGKGTIGATGLAGRIAKNPISNWLYRGATPGTKAATQAAAKTTPWGQIGKQVVAEGGYGFGAANKGFNPNLFFTTSRMK